MNISDLRDGMRRVDVKGEIVDVSKPRDVSLRAGGTATTAEAVLKDLTGTIDLSLWDDQIEQVAKGLVVEVTNGYTNSYQGKLRLNVGKFGKLVAVGKAKPAEVEVQLPITDRETFIREVIDQRLKELKLIA